MGHGITPVPTTGDYDLAIGETAPGVPGPPPHHHTQFAELFFVLKGEMEFTVNGETRLLREGEWVDLPPNTLHTFRNPGPGPNKWLNLHSPKGFHAFFHSFGVPATQENAFRESVSETMVARVGSLAATFDMHIVLEPSRVA